MYIFIYNYLTATASLELNENWFDIREPVKDGMKFNVKYIGLTKVDQPTGEKMSSDAVQRIFNLVRCFAYMTCL